MSRLDVSDLAREQLPTEAFPADLRAVFRLHLAPQVHQGIERHAKEDDSVEICGVLVGRWGRDDEGPFALATDYIRCDNAASKFAEVTFTHESWAAINREMDTKYADKRIIGWYHSHPDFGIFLSERDCFIHEHFFNGAGQIAYVIDPVRDLEGVFSWQEGKPAPMSYFWVGSDIHTVQASQRSPARAGGDSAVRGAAASSAAQTAPAGGGLLAASSFPTALTLLAWISLFLLGYGCADWRSRFEQRRLAEGAVAHYGYTKLMKLGLDDELAKVRQALRAIAFELGKLPKSSEQLSAEDAKKADDNRKVLGDTLQLTEKKLEQIQQRYSLSKDEMAVYAQLMAQKQAELELPQVKTPVPSTPPPNLTVPSTTTPQASPPAPGGAASPPSPTMPPEKTTTEPSKPPAADTPKPSASPPSAPEPTTTAPAAKADAKN